MKMLRVLTFTLTLALGFTTGPLALAYTGAYGIMPAFMGGPDSSYVTQFDIDTENGPATISANLYYVHSLVIETDRELESHILIKEYPTGGESTFDIIVPQPVQNALVSATVFIWGPDVDTLTIRHEHQGDETQYVSGVKVDPVVTNSDGNVLWSFTVTSFSTFSYFNPLAQDASWNLLTIAGAWLLLIWFTTAAPLAMRHR